MFIWSNNHVYMELTQPPDSGVSIERIKHSSIRLLSNVHHIRASSRRRGVLSRYEQESFPNCLNYIHDLLGSAFCPWGLVVWCALGPNYIHNLLESAFCLWGLVIWYALCPYGADLVCSLPLRCWWCQGRLEPASVMRLGTVPVVSRPFGTGFGDETWYDAGEGSATSLVWCGWRQGRFYTGFGDKAQCGVGNSKAVFRLASVTRLSIVWVIPRPFLNWLRRRDSDWCRWYRRQGSVTRLGVMWVTSRPFLHRLR